MKKGLEREASKRYQIVNCLFIKLMLIKLNIERVTYKIFFLIILGA